MERRRLIDLVSVGKATLEDFKNLGIHSVADLTTCEASELYERLCGIRGVRLDPCCEDVFAAAIAQAKDPGLPKEQCQWWYWSRLRKAKGN